MTCSPSGCQTLESALLIYDTDGGYRTFLGADPLSANQLSSQCDQIIDLTESYVAPPLFEILANRFGQILHRPIVKRKDPLTLEQFREGIVYQSHRYFPEMLDWVAEQIAFLVDEKGVSPSEIVVLSPFLSDALRYSLTEKLQSFGRADPLAPPFARPAR